MTKLRPTRWTRVRRLSGADLGAAACRAATYCVFIRGLSAASMQCTARRNTRPQAEPSIQKYVCVAVSSLAFLLDSIVMFLRVVVCLFDCLFVCLFVVCLFAVRPSCCLAWFTWSALSGLSALSALSGLSGLSGLSALSGLSEQQKTSKLD